MAAAPVDLACLITELQFTPVGPQTALGQRQGVPMSLTVLSHDPPGVMLQFRCDPEGEDSEQISNLLAGAPEDRVKLTIVKDSIWLSLYNLSGDTNESVRQLIDLLAGTIQSTDLQVPAGCLRCGMAESDQLMYAGERPTRLCPTCLQAAVDAQQAAEAELNRTTLGGTLGLPACLAILAAGWGLFWGGLDLGLEWLGIREIEINAFTIPIGLGVLAGGAYLLSKLAVGTFRRSALVRQAPMLLIGALLLTAIFGGEVVYLFLILLLRFGIFDPQAAAQFVGDFIQSFTGFWIVCKLLMAIAMYVLTLGGTIETQTARLDV